VFNGDIGTITTLDLEEQRMTVNVDGQPVAYDWLDADELVLAYAASVHKAQGSEYRASCYHSSRNIIDASEELGLHGVTRAKKLAVIVGSRKALAMAVKNTRSRSVTARWTFVCEYPRTRHEHTSRYSCYGEIHLKLTLRRQIAFYKQQSLWLCRPQPTPKLGGLAAESAERLPV